MKLKELIKIFKSKSHLIAIDIGSNSFHMLITKIDHGELRPIDALSEKIQLGAGLHDGKLSAASIKNGLAAGNYTQCYACKNPISYEDTKSQFLMILEESTRKREDCISSRIVSKTFSYVFEETYKRDT